MARINSLTHLEVVPSKDGVSEGGIFGEWKFSLTTYFGGKEKKNEIKLSFPQCLDLMLLKPAVDRLFQTPKATSPENPPENPAEEQMEVQESVESTNLVPEDANELSPAEPKTTAQDLQRGGKLQPVMPTQSNIRRKKYAPLRL
jgi:hypothetical protein